ncbi:hypothetical protein MMC25_006813 [Agyrium rufum]|nr:hypothetical protein [Agyrium rufum]
MDSSDFTGERLIKVVCWTTMLVALTFLYPQWREYAKSQAMRQQYGCKDLLRCPHQDGNWGSDLGPIRSDAMKEGRLFKLYESQFELYGKTFEENFRGKRLINTIEPANIQQITTLAFDDYCKDPERTKAQAPFLGPSIFSDGPVWKQSRALVKAAFARAEIPDIDHLASFTDRFMELIPGDGSTADMQPLLHRLPSALSFSKPFRKLRDGNKRGEAGWLRLYYDFDKDWKESYKTVHRFIDREVERALRETKNEDEIEKVSTPSRKRYVLLDEMAKQIRDPVKLRYQILGVFLPGRDTASIAVGPGDKPLIFVKLKTLVDFRNVVHETIRLSGPAARVWRVASRDTILPSGGGPDRKSPVFVPKGTAVVMGTWCVHHDRDIWGDDVQDFKPDRWISRKPQWEFVPFLGGPRMCPAQQQVLMHVVYILVRLTQRFESIESRDPVFEYVEKFTMAFESRSGVKVAFRQASAQ